MICRISNKFFLTQGRRSSVKFRKRLKASKLSWQSRSARIMRSCCSSKKVHKLALQINKNRNTSMNKKLDSTFNRLLSCCNNHKSITVLKVSIRNRSELNHLRLLTAQLLPPSPPDPGMLLQSLSYPAKKAL